MINIPKSIKALLKEYDDASPIDRRIEKARPEIERLSGRLGLQKVVEDGAEFIYLEASKKNLVRGRSAATVAATSVYASCRQSKLPRTLKEIAEESLVGKKDVARYYRLLLREGVVSVPNIDPLTYFSKVAGGVGISKASQQIALSILSEAKRLGYDRGKDPAGISAAAAYAACVMNNEKKIQKDIADAAGVAECTVRKRYKTLVKQLGLSI